VRGSEPRGREGESASGPTLFAAGFLTRVAQAGDRDWGAPIGGQAAAHTRLAARRGGEDVDRNGHAEAGCSEGAGECGGPGAGEGEVAG
jgi:hypothetical protein